MEMIKVESSQIEKMGHDAATNTMVVEFKGGSTYSYENVGSDMFHLIVHDTISVGKAFNARIKKFPALYPYKKV